MRLLQVSLENLNYKIDTILDLRLLCELPVLHIDIKAAFIMVKWSGDWVSEWLVI